MSKAVVRLDNIEGAIPVSLNYYSDASTEAAIENGRFVYLDSLVTGERELWKAIAPADVDNDNCKISTGRLALVASPEYMTSGTAHNLDEFENAAGDAARGYILKKGNIISFSAEAFYGSTQPTSTNKYVTLYADGNTLLTSTSSVSNNLIGLFIGSDVVGTQTYYAVYICGEHDQ